MKKILLNSLLAILICSGCKQPANTIQLVDSNASPETIQLYKNLKRNSKAGFMFGHQDALSYGIGWKYRHEPGRCDIYDLVGDYPGIFGWDLGHLEVGSDKNIDSVPFESIRTNIIKAYELGAVNSISWHPFNPVTGGNTWDNTQTVKHILPGAPYHAKFKTWLNRVGHFLRSVKNSEGTPIPIVWRPFHEHNGGWFWWGEDSTSVEEYINLWRFTVHYFKDTLKVNNLLWAYSPNLFQSKAEYLAKYPGDNYVDILGCDVYDFPRYGTDYKTVAPKNIGMLKELGHEKDKVYAFTETGRNKLEAENWWTGSLLPAIYGSGVAWILVWRNAHLEHFFAPYPGQLTEADFKAFYHLPQTLFASDVRKLNSKLE